MEGRCEECKIRDDDFSKKLLFKCRHCERYFCKKHLSPKMVLTREFIDSTKDRVLRDKLYKEWEREGGHPDWSWSRKHFDDLKAEEGEELKKYLRWFDGLNRRRSSKNIHILIFHLKLIYGRMHRRNHPNVTPKERAAIEQSLPLDR
ncbi:MAG: hypothetical protein NT016_01785 [Candidatus Aenigmarchaeota archaeon]|nr:hypothetical protein [Candidatus Aenigmarchaeota archaeon]